MRLWTKLVRPRGRLSLRRALFAALVLVALAAGMLPVHAEGPDVQLDTGMDIDFHTSTPPIRKGVICVGKDYMIIPRPFVRSLNIPYDHPLNKSHYPWHWYQARIDVSSALIGTIVPPFHVLSQQGASQPWAYPAVFSYRSARIGHEKLEFTAKTPGLSGIKYSITPNQDPKDYATGWFHSAKAKFEFEVVNCGYEVTMIYKGVFASAGTSGAGIGLRLDTKLVRKEDGTFEGSGSFVMEQTRNVPSCSFSLDDFQAPTRITGTILENTGELQLNFEYGKGTYSASGACPGAGGATSSHTVDVAQLIGVRSVRFPQAGGTKQLPTPRIPAWTITYTITVEPEVETGDLPVGG